VSTIPVHLPIANVRLVASAVGSDTDLPCQDPRFTSSFAYLIYSSAKCVWF